MQVDQLILEHSRVVVQWREDGTFLVAREKELPEILQRPPSVPSWREPFDASSVAGIEEASVGDRPDPTWWVLYGCADKSVEVSVRVEAESVPDPVVHRVGEVWVCEWVSFPTVAHIHRSDQEKVTDIRFRRAQYLPPAPYPVVERITADENGPPQGWTGFQIPTTLGTRNSPSTVRLDSVGAAGGSGRAMLA